MPGIAPGYRYHCCAASRAVASFASVPGDKGMRSIAARHRAVASFASVPGDEGMRSIAARHRALLRRLRQCLAMRGCVALLRGIARCGDMGHRCSCAWRLCIFVAFKPLAVSSGNFRGQSGHHCMPRPGHSQLLQPATKIICINAAENALSYC